MIHLFLAIVLSDGLTVAVAAAAAALPDPISSGATTASSLPRSLIPADGAAATASSPLSRFYPFLIPPPFVLWQTPPIR